VSQPVAPPPAAQPPRRPVAGPPAAAPAREHPALDLGLRFAAGILATAFGALVALLTAFLVPLRFAGYAVPVAFVVALAGNIAVVWFARYATASRIGVLGPCVAWLAVMVVLSTRTAEGDLILPGDWRGIGVLFVGATGLAIAGFLAISPPRRPAPAAPRVTTPREVAGKP
jgi:hypothetical protein